VAKANGYENFPNSFIHLYLAFKFSDGTQGSPVYYGWVDASLSNPLAGSGPDLTIFRYAYDNTGAKIPMGAIPEPAPAALLALVLWRSALKAFAPGVINALLLPWFVIGSHWISIKIPFGRIGFSSFLIIGLCRAHS
jgi:hypothetical protein